MHLFYTPDISSDSYVLSEEESKHANKVLRLSTGDQVRLLDGKGGFYLAAIQEAHPKKCRLQILESVQQYGKRPYSVQIAVAPTKNLDRIEWFIEKATEIGIDDIYFLNCERSERKNLNLDRLDRIVVSGMKQSVKAYKPNLHEMVSFKDFINDRNNSQTFIAHLEAHDRLPLRAINPANSCCILIGPEGDFSPKEINLAYEVGIKPVTLGNSRLRTETAALVACHTVNLIQEMKLA